MKKNKILLTLSSIFLTLFGYQNIYSQDSGASGSAEEGLEYLLFMEIPEVVTSTLTEKNILTAPSSMTVITENEILQSGAKDLLELIGHISGFHVVKNDLGRNIITMRGVREWLSNNKYKLLVNGHNIIDQVYGSFEDFYRIGLENVKQIEIIRGPGSCLYGANAFAGVINIITKKPSDVNGVNLGARYQSYNSKEASITYGKAISDKDIDLGIDFNYYKSDGAELNVKQDMLYGTPFSIAPYKIRAGKEYWKSELSFRYQNLNIYFSYNDSMLETPLNQFDTLTEKPESRNYKFSYIEADYDIPFSDAFTLKNRLSCDILKLVDKLQAFPRGYTLYLDLNGDGIPEPADMNEDGMAEYYADGGLVNFGFRTNEFRWESVFDFKTSDTNQLLCGVFFEETKLNDIFIKGTVNPLYYYTTNGSETDWSGSFPHIKEANRKIYGVFIQDEINFAQNLYFILGGRYDKYNDFGSTLNPRCGFVYDINQKGGIIKIIYGTAFKAPNFSQLYNQNNPSVVGRENLDAEKLNSIECSLNYIFQEKFQTNITLYKLNTKDQIDQSTEPDYSLPLNPVYYINQGKAKVWGMELENRYYFSNDNYLLASYNYTNGKDTLLDIDLPLVAKHQFTAGFNLNFNEKYNWHFILDYTGEMPRESNDIRDDIQATTVVDTSFSILTAKNIELYFSVYNLTDEKIISPVSFNVYPADDLPDTGRNFGAGLKYKF